MQKLSPLVHSAMPILIGLMRDPHVMVKDSSTWTIGKICELHGPSIPGEVLTPLVEALLLALKDTPRVCSKACFALHNFGDQFEESRDAESNQLSPYLTALVQELLLATQRDDGNFFSFIFCCIGSFAFYHARDECGAREKETKSGSSASFFYFGILALNNRGHRCVMFLFLPERGGMNSVQSLFMSFGSNGVFFRFLF